MTVINFELQRNLNGSALGTRTILHQIRYGSFIHTRLVRGKGYKISTTGSGGPSLQRLASGLHEQEDPAFGRGRIKSSFEFMGGDDFGNKHVIPDRFYFETEGTIPIIKKECFNGAHFSGICVFGRGFVVDDGLKPLSDPKQVRGKWMDVEIDYDPHRRDGIIYFMKKTIEPLPLEQLSWSEVFEILKRRPGSVVRFLAPNSGVYREWRVFENVESLEDRNRNYPIEYINFNFVFSCSHCRDISGKKKGKWFEFDKARGGFQTFFYPQEKMDALPPPYILANGEVHFQTPEGWQITSFPLSKAARGRLIKSATSQPKANQPPAEKVA